MLNSLVFAALVKKALKLERSVVVQVLALLVLVGVLARVMGEKYSQED
jgi:Na+/glutamate symporter